MPGVEKGSLVTFDSITFLNVNNYSTFIKTVFLEKHFNLVCSAIMDLDKLNLVMVVGFRLLANICYCPICLKKYYSF